MLGRSILRSLNPALRKDTSALVRQTSRRTMHNIDKPVTMNDLPVPNGSWKENYNRKNGRYNTMLLTSIITLIATISIGNSMDIINWNYSIPRLD